MPDAGEGGEGGWRQTEGTIKDVSENHVKNT